MEPGWIPDATRSEARQTTWVPGAPEPRSFFLGVQWKASRSVPMQALRCAQCGFIELYARPL
jgi:hypothetical protein